MSIVWYHLKISYEKLKMYIANPKTTAKTRNYIIQQRRGNRIMKNRKAEKYEKEQRTKVGNINTKSIELKLTIIILNIEA